LLRRQDGEIAEEATMSLDPLVRQYLDMVAAAARPPINQLPPALARQGFLETRAPLQGPKLETVTTQDRTIPGPGGALPIRVYRARTASAKELLPALVYFHGGGWVLGNIESHDQTCRYLAQDSGVAVVSVDYRLAPEHPFPAAFEDAVAALRWVADNGEQIGVDQHLLAVGGDSAGGNLAAAVAIWARDRHTPPLRLQLLVYPALDCSTSTDSYARFADGYLLTRESMAWFFDQYVPKVPERTNWRAAPLRAASLAGVTSALVVTAGHDPLRDEGRAYARRLQSEGVPVDFVEFGGMIHGFFGMPAILPASRRGLALAAAALHEALVERAEESL
jgi:acetyl esterase